VGPCVYSLPTPKDRETAIFGIDGQKNSVGTFPRGAPNALTHPFAKNGLGRKVCEQLRRSELKAAQQAANCRGLLRQNKRDRRIGGKRMVGGRHGKNRGRTIGVIAVKGKQERETQAKCHRVWKKTCRRRGAEQKAPRPADRLTLEVEGAARGRPTGPRSRPKSAATGAK